MSLDNGLLCGRMMANGKTASGSWTIGVARGGLERPMQRIYVWPAIVFILAGIGAAGAEPLKVPSGDRVAVPGVMPGNDNLKKLKLPANPRIMVIPATDQESTRYGWIDWWQVRFVSRRLDEAAAGKYDLVILEIDTHGGFIHSCQRINRAVAECPVPTIAYIRGTAFSGGAIIAHGCRAVVMEPGSTIGGAQAVGLLGDLGKDERAKMRELLVTTMHALCEKNGYPAPIAQGMVDMGLTVYETDNPKNRFMTGPELEDWQKNEITRGKAPNIVSTWKAPRHHPDAHIATGLRLWAGLQPAGGPPGAFRSVGRRAGRSR